MEKKHRCRLCFRNFANGRALGGHMRSHMMKFYAEERASKQENGALDHDFHSLRSYSLQSSSSSEDDDEEEEYEEERGGGGGERRAASYELRENPKKSAVMADHDFLSAAESETESSEKSRRNPICRRSKRVREMRISDFEALDATKRSKVFEQELSSPVSSISDTTPEEHVAHCLIMLSQDKWEKEEAEYNNEEEEEEESKKLGDVAKTVIKNKFRGKYRCEECNKLFRSYQALGGHRASHKKIKANTTTPAATASPPPSTAVKIHQCPFCDRIFASGQALGGHKRSHFIGAGAIPTNHNSINEKNSRISQPLSIDLNLPAPLDDDDGSQIAVSAVSDAEFVPTIKQ